MGGYIYGLPKFWEINSNFAEFLQDLHQYKNKVHELDRIQFSEGANLQTIFPVLWEEVKFYAQLFDFPTVPELPIVQPLADFTQKYTDEDTALAQWLTANLGATWTDSVQTAGKLGGYDPKTGEACSEGFVIRNAADFATNNGNLPVQSNEFDNLFKLVRAKHVKTDVHWTKTWKPARLIDYDKYHWQSWQFQTT